MNKKLQNLCHFRFSQMGRTVLETLGFLALLVLLTFGGIKVFSFLHSRSIAKNLESAIAYRIIAQQHAHLSSKKSSRTKEMAPHEVPMTVTDGPEGDFTLSQVFWIELGDSSHTINKIICQYLVNSKAYFPIKITFDNDVIITSSEQCLDYNVLRFYFWKKEPSSNSNLPDITIKLDNCEERICPIGAICKNNTLTCQPGYRQAENGCTQTCSCCLGNTYSSTENASECSECGSAQIPNENHTACINIKIGEPCPDGGFADGKGECVECLNKNHCEQEFPARECIDNTCQNCSIDEPDCCATGYPDGNGNCVECTEPSQCPAGTCDPSTNTCSKCPAGQYLLGTDCTACPIGTYKESIGNQECTSCGEHETTETTGSTSSAQCKCQKGYFKMLNSCQPCPSGTYKSDIGNTNCTACGTHATTIDEATSSINDCVCLESDYPYPDGNGNCVKCTTDSNCNNTTGYCDLSDHTCKERPCAVDSDCPPNESCTGYPTKKCSCKSGYERKNGVCTPCEIGYYLQNEVCTPCPEFSTTEETGAASISFCKCEIGYYMDSQNKVCRHCPEFSTTNSSGATSISSCLCQAGYYWDNNGQICSPCPIGTYKSYKGNHTCNSCSDSIRNSTTLQEGATSMSECICPEFSTSHLIDDIHFSSCECEIGYYMDSQNKVCRHCPEFSTTNSSGATSISSCLCQAGYYWDDNGQICSPCPIGTYKTAKGNFACNSCYGDLTTLQEGTTDESECVCPDGYIQEDVSCVPACQSNSDCNSGQFCNIRNSSDSCLEPGLGVCMEIGTVNQLNISTTMEVYSSYSLTWWAANNWCEAQGLHLPDVEDLLCYHSCESPYTCTLDWHTTPIRTGHDGGHCLDQYTNYYINTSPYILTISKHPEKFAFSMRELYKKIKNEFWLRGSGKTNCSKLAILTTSGYISVRTNLIEEKRRAICGNSSGSLRDYYNSQYPLQSYYPYQDTVPTSSCLEVVQRRCE